MPPLHWLQTVDALLFELGHPEAGMVEQAAIEAHALQPCDVKP